MLKDHIQKFPKLLLVLVFVLGSVLVYGGYKHYALGEKFKAARTDILSLYERLEQFQKEFEISEKDNKELREALYAERERNDAFQEDIDMISGTVGVLEKLSKTDPELLQKYSKVYFLNEHYTPSELSLIDKEYLYQKDKPLEIHTKVLPYLNALVEEAREDGIDLLVISAYRSYGTQAILKSSYTVTYGAGTANQFSADQGYSEHQLGTTVDFTTSAIASSFSNFEKTEAYAWLVDNAYKYGFVLSYPEKNGYYQFEPWHWRFVGEALARDLKRNNTYFYNMDQRKIDEYLVEIF